MSNPTLPTSATPVWSRSSQISLLVLIVVLLALLGWRWCADQFGTRPSTWLRSEQPGKAINLNQATRGELLQLPGIGPHIAEHILAFRDSKGHIHNVDDLQQVSGIGPTTLHRLKPWLYVEPVSEEEEPEVLRLVRKPAVPKEEIVHKTYKKPISDTRIRINQATQEELQTLPGIGPVLAQRIWDERQRKPFQSVEDLRRVSGIGPKRLEQIRPFVDLE